MAAIAAEKCPESMAKSTWTALQKSKAESATSVYEKSSTVAANPAASLREHVEKEVKALTSSCTRTAQLGR